MSNHQRERIPQKVRNDLWIAAAGRCEFKGCTKPIGLDFLTGKKSKIGEYAHIIADSPNGPRGDSKKSLELAKSQENLILACFDCHKRIDTLATSGDYSVELLQRWKHEHEDSIARLYNSASATKSLMIIMSFPINDNVVKINTTEVISAVLQNSDYAIHPASNPVILNRSHFDANDKDDSFWEQANKSVEKWFNSHLSDRLSGDDGFSHLSIAAFAPIPLLIKLGSLIGSKIPALILDLPNNKWKWHSVPETTKISLFTYAIPEKVTERVFVPIEISNQAANYEHLTTDFDVVKFSSVTPMRELIKCQRHLEDFRIQFTKFMDKLHAAGARTIEILPVTSLCASVEIGRVILPKIYERVGIWEYRNSNWKHTLNIVSQ